MSRFHAPRSFLALYPDGSSTPVASACWTASDCRGPTCLYTARLPATATREASGVQRWHAGLFGAKQRVHLVGRLAVE